MLFHLNIIVTIIKIHDKRTNFRYKIFEKNRKTSNIIIIIENLKKGLKMSVIILIIKFLRYFQNSTTLFSFEKTRGRGWIFIF